MCSRSTLYALIWMLQSNFLASGKPVTVRASALFGPVTIWGKGLSDRFWQPFVRFWSGSGLGGGERTRHELVGFAGKTTSC